jgi:hypothetical protein
VRSGRSARQPRAGRDEAVHAAASRQSTGLMTPTELVSYDTPSQKNVLASDHKMLQQVKFDDAAIGIYIYVLYIIYKAAQHFNMGCSLTGMIVNRHQSAGQ